MTESRLSNASGLRGLNGPPHVGTGRRRLAALAGGAVLTLAVALPTSAAAATTRTAAHKTASQENEYRQRNLVSDIPGVARTTDPNLVNPWGMAAGPATPIWVSDNGTDSTTLYKGATHHDRLTPLGLVVSIPGGAPTGQVFNPSDDWVVKSGSSSGPALFIFASENGSIQGWNPGVPPPAPSTAAQNGVTTPGAVYKGLAITTGSGGDFLYAANFHAGTIDVFNDAFAPLHWAGAFSDPSLPAGYAPFNIQNLGGRLYVTYALQKPDKHDDLAGPGHGFIDVYDLKGTLLKRLVSGGPLNSPWGLEIAPSDFGRFGEHLLVGNFGDGRINVFDVGSGDFDGQLKNEDGDFIAIQGLWGLRFGNGVAGTPHTLFFTAGIADEQHGLMGTIEAVR